MTRTTKTTTRKPISPNANKVNVNSNKVKVNANKVDINAARVAANAAKVRANAAKVKANATKMSAVKVTPKVTATKAVVNNKVKMATFVPTAKSTKGKSYLISTKQGDMFGTAAQADSATRAKNLYNEFSRSGRAADRNIPKNPNASTTRGFLTKESEKLRGNYSSTLPSYVPPKNTGAGPLLKRSEVQNATGRGGCRPGYRLDAGGNCVKN